MKGVLRGAVALLLLVVAASCGDTAADDKASGDPDLQRTEEIADRILQGVQGNGTGAAVTRDNVHEWIDLVAKDVQEFWKGSSATTEWDVNYVILRPGETHESRCRETNDKTGETRSKVYNSRSAAYCPADDTIYLGADLMFSVYDTETGIGDFAAAIIVAHEAGHNFQSDVRVPKSAERPELDELQADCFAGAWAQWVDREGRLDEGDIAEAVAASARVGDFGFEDDGFHGTPAQRQEAFLTGYRARNGGLECFIYTPGRRN